MATTDDVFKLLKAVNEVTLQRMEGEIEVLTNATVGPIRAMQQEILAIQASIKAINEVTLKRMEDLINAVNTTTLGRMEAEIQLIEAKVGV